MVSILGLRYCVAFLHLAPAYTNQPQTPSSEKWKRRWAISYTTANLRPGQLAGGDYEDEGLF
ncbi:Uncharacterised protein [Yersinia enterocolitica]|nr:Uncharacterised protein [Yersinia enterocolitica]